MHRHTSSMGELVSSDSEFCYDSKQRKIGTRVRPGKRPTCQTNPAKKNLHPKGREHLIQSGELHPGNHSALGSPDIHAPSVPPHQVSVSSDFEDGAMNGQVPKDLFFTLTTFSNSPSRTLANTSFMVAACGSLL